MILKSHTEAYGNEESSRICFSFKLHVKKTTRFPKRAYSVPSTETKIEFFL